MNREEFLEERDALRLSYRYHLERQSLDTESPRGASMWGAKRVYDARLKLLRSIGYPLDDREQQRFEWVLAYRAERLRNAKMLGIQKKMLQQWLPGFVKIITDEPKISKLLGDKPE